MSRRELAERVRSLVESNHRLRRKNREAAKKARSRQPPVGKTKQQPTWTIKEDESKT